MTPSSPSHPWSVSVLNGRVAKQLELSYRSVWVTGEVSNLASARYGHRYFSLKDHQGNIACVWFLGQQKSSTVELKEGLQILVRGTVSLYSARGTYQIQIEHVEEAGFGALQQAFLALKKTLSERGWFDIKHKQSLPPYPANIGVITSPMGAALQDILSVLSKRYPMAKVWLYPALVQGEGAPDSLVQAVSLACEHKQADVLIVARGGGSLEDLWAFNDERVAKAIFECPIAVISGVGHEVDTTIVDGVADVRAPTPSAAAEQVAPDQRALLQRLYLHEQYLHKWMGRVVQQQRLLLQALSHRCQHPQKRLWAQQHQLQMLWHRLAGLVPQQQAQQQLLHVPARLSQAMQQILHDKQQRLLALMHRLEGISPMATLQRGYAKVMQGDQVVHSVEHLQVGDDVAVQLAQGAFNAKVHEIVVPD